LTVGSVRTAVIPAAGVGTRLLPVTKAVPKELLTVVDRPSRQWVVEEALAAGIDETVIVTSSPKKPLEDQFSQMIELESVLEERENLELLDRVRRITDLATFHFALQPSPPGLGHAILVAAPHGGRRAIRSIAARRTSSRRWPNRAADDRRRRVSGGVGGLADRNRGHRDHRVRMRRLLGA
jgi:UTP-glucose-1-phosphate uridylyltransferase